MSFVHRQFRPQTHSFAERRLCRQTLSDPEKRPTRMVEILKGKEHVQEQMEDLLEDVKDGQQAELFSRVRTELAKLKPEELLQVEQNLLSLDVSSKFNLVKTELIALAEFTQDGLKKIKAAVSSAPSEEEPPAEPKKPKAPAPSFMERVGGYFSGSVQTAQEYWNKSPGLRKTAVGVGVGAAVAIAALGLWKLSGWAFGKAKEKVEKTTETVVQTGSAIKTTLLVGSGLALAGIAGYLAWTNMQQFFQNQVDTLRNEAKQRAERLKEEAEKKAQEIREQADEKLAEVQEQGRRGLEQAREQTNELAQELNERESVEALKENSSRQVTEFALQLYLKDDKVHDVLAEMKKNGWKIGDILALYDKDTGDVIPGQEEDLATQIAPSEATDKGAFVDTAKKIIVFCGSHEPLMRKLFESNEENKKQGKTFEGMSIDEYVQQAGGSLTLLTDIQEHAADLKNLDFQKSMKKLRENGSSALSVGIGSVHSEKLKLKEFPEDLKDVTPAEILEYMESEGLTRRKVASILSNKDDVYKEEEITTLRAAFEEAESALNALPPAPEGDDVDDPHASKRRTLRLAMKKAKSAYRHELAGKALFEICTNHLPSAELLQPFFHEVLPDEDWDYENMGVNHAHIEDYVLNDMTLGRVMRFFTYRQMLASEQSTSQASALAAIQFEILQFIELKDQGEIFGHFKTKQKQAIYGMLEKLSDANYWDTIVKATGVTYNVVSELLPMLEGPGASLLSTLTNTILGPVEEGFEWYLALRHRNAPLFWGGTLLGGGYLANKFAIGPTQSYFSWRMARTNLDHAAYTLTTTAESRWWLTPGRSLWYSVNPMAGDKARIAAGKQLDLLKSGCRSLRGDRAAAAEGRLLAWFRNGAFPDEMGPKFVDPLKKEIAVLEDQIKAAQKLGRPIDDLQDSVRALQSLIKDAEDFARLPDHQIARRALMRYARPITGYPADAYHLFYGRLTETQVRRTADALLDEALYLRQMARNAEAAGETKKAAQFAKQFEDLLADPFFKSKQFTNLARTGSGNVQILNDLVGSRMTFEALDKLIDARLAGLPRNAGAEAIIKFADEFEDIARRAFIFREFIDQPAMLANLLVKGARADDLIHAGASSKAIIAMSLDLKDETARLAAMRELASAGYVDELFEACKAKGVTHLDELMDLAKTGEGLEALTAARLVDLFDGVVAPGSMMPKALDSLPTSWKVSEELATMRLQYADEALDAFDAAAKRLALIDNLSLTDAITLLKKPQVLSVMGDVTKYGGQYIDDAVVLALKTKAPMRSVNKIITYLSAMGPHATGVMTDPKIIKAIIKWDVQPAGIAKIISSLRKTAELADKGGDVAKAALSAQRALNNADEMLRVIARAQAATLRGFVGLMALEAVALGFDIYMYYEAKQRVEDSKRTIDSMLTSNGFTKTGAGSKITYTHQKTGIRVDGTFLFERLDDQTEQPFNRILYSAAGTAATTFAYLSPMVAFGPAGIAVALITIGVHGVSEAFEQDDKRKFLTEMDMGVLALIGFGSAVGTSDFDGLAAASNGMISDVFHSSEFNREQKAEIRKRAVMVMFTQECGRLVQTHPALYGEIMGEKDVFELATERGDLYSEDFKKVVMPYLSVRLFELADKEDDVTWADFRELKIDTGWFDFTNVSIENMRMALRESAVLYVQHLREKRYRAAKAEYAEMPRGTTEEQIVSREKLADLAKQEVAYELEGKEIEALGQRSVLGMPVASYEYKDVSDPTQVELLLARVRKQLDDNSTMEVVVDYYGPDVWDRTREMYGKSFFMVEAPEGLQAVTGKKEIPLWQLPYAALAAKPEHEPEVRQAAFNARLKNLRDNMDPWHQYRANDSIRAWGTVGLTEHDRTQMQDLFFLLYQFPEFDPDGVARDKLNRVGNWRNVGAKSDMIRSGMPLDRKHIEITLPDGFCPECTRRKMPMWQLPFFLAQESKEQDEAVRYNDFYSRAIAISAKLYKFERRGFNNRWESLHTADYQLFMEYYALLREYPEFDEDGRMRKLILSLPQYNWTKHNPMQEHPHWKVARSLELRIGQHVDHWAQFNRQYNPLDIVRVHSEFMQVQPVDGNQFETYEIHKKLEQKSTAYFDIPGMDALSTFSSSYYSNGQKEMFVTIDGKEQSITALDPKGSQGARAHSKYIEGVGTFYVVSRSRRNENGRNEYYYNWYFKPGPKASSFTLTYKNKEDLVQYAKKIEVAERAPKQTVSMPSNVPAYPINWHWGTNVTVELEDGRTATWKIARGQKHEFPEVFSGMKREFDVVFDVYGSRQYDADFFIIPKDNHSIKSVTITPPPYGFGPDHTQDLRTRTTELTFPKESPKVLSEKVVEKHNEAIAILGLKRVAEGVYTREGYEGRYFLQSDGSVYHTGGRHPDGELHRPATYYDGVWLASYVPPMREDVARLSLLQFMEFGVPVRRYKMHLSDPVNNSFFEVVLDPNRPIPPQVLERWDVKTDKRMWLFTPKKHTYGVYSFWDLETGEEIEVVAQYTTHTALREREAKINEYREQNGITTKEIEPWESIRLHTSEGLDQLQGQISLEYREQLIEKEIARRKQVLKEVLEVVPTLRLMNSGVYYDDVTMCAYNFNSLGEFTRSRGYPRGGYDYIPPAIFENGRWVIQPDPYKEEFMADLAERRDKKTNEIQQKYKPTNLTLESGERDVLLAGKLATEDSEAVAEEMVGTCTLQDGTELEFSIAPDGTISGPGGEHFEAKRFFEKSGERNIAPLLDIRPKGYDIVQIELANGETTQVITVTHDYLDGSKPEYVEQETGLTLKQKKTILSETPYLNGRHITCYLKDGSKAVYSFEDGANRYGEDDNNPEEIGLYVWDNTYDESTGTSPYDDMVLNHKKPSEVFKKADDSLVTIGYTETQKKKEVLSFFNAGSQAIYDIDITVNSPEVERIEVYNNGKVEVYQVNPEKK